MRLSSSLDAFPATTKRDMNSSTSRAQADTGFISDYSKTQIELFWRVVISLVLEGPGFPSKSWRIKFSVATGLNNTWLSITLMLCLTLIKTELSFSELWVSSPTAALICRRCQHRITDLMKVKVLHESVRCQQSSHLDTASSTLPEMFVRPWGGSSFSKEEFYLLCWVLYKTLCCFSFIHLCASWVQRIKALYTDLRVNFETALETSLNY